MCNLGKIDRAARALIGVVAIVAAILTPYWWLAIVGVVALGTALISFCPLYLLIGLDTGCKAKEN